MSNSKIKQPYSPAYKEDFVGGKVERTFFLPIKRAQAHAIINESMLFAQAVSDRVYLVKKCLYIAKLGLDRFTSN